MDITIIPGKLSGTIAAISSKSHLHRVLICAALADHDTEIYCSSVSNDIEATISCLRALNSKIIRTETGYHVVPIQSPPQTAILNCGESGTTLRFMLPIVGALGISGTFLLSGRLTERPLLPLWEQMEKHGCSIQKAANDTLLCSGQLHAGTFHFPGNISSQFISGVLLAMPLLNGSSKINIEGILQSEPYVNMTLSVMEQFGIKISDYEIPTAQPYISPGRYTIEGDWSNSAFFIAANAIGNQIYNTNIFRFPGGSVGGKYHDLKADAKSLLEQNNIASIDWNALNGDAERLKTEEELLERLKETIQNKNSVVILMHDAGDKTKTYNILPQVIEYLREEGYEFKTFYDILNK